jgi:4-amino-4-deoxy-L-arabinose transferase-like glycosyltransferase
MAEAVLSLLAFAVFAALWLSTQDWFDLLPRRAMRAFVVAAPLCSPSPATPPRPRSRPGSPAS